MPRSPARTLSGMTGFGSWVSGAATDADSCPFSCASGYTVSGRMCNKARPQTLALGQDTSRVLFDNGEVEAWGKVSASPWRSHIKEDLGSQYSAQALASGDYHQCIILKNAALNHGRLMCWGQNSNRQLGVGDTNPRSYSDSCWPYRLGRRWRRQPQDGQVRGGRKRAYLRYLKRRYRQVCWGRNNMGQIGGGTAGANKTISGTSGEPLRRRNR